MAAPLRSRFTLLTLLACTFAACGGTSLPRAVTIEPGRTTAVALHQTTNGVTLTLINRSAVADGALYSGTSSDKNRKIAPDADLQTLLDVLSAKKFFEVALPQPVPDAIDMLIVEHGGKRWVWSRRRAGLQATEADYYEARDYFMAAYNSVVAYHGTGGERPVFRGEERRPRDDARKPTAPRNQTPPPTSPRNPR